MDSEQYKESEREKIMPGRGRVIVVEGRGVVGSEKGRRGRGEEWECVLDCAFLCLYVFSPYSCGTYESLLMPWNIKGNGKLWLYLRILTFILTVVNLQYLTNLIKSELQDVSSHYLQWGKKVFSQPPIVQVLPLKKMREACNFHHSSTMRDKIK